MEFDRITSNASRLGGARFLCCLFAVVCCGGQTVDTSHDDSGVDSANDCGDFAGESHTFASANDAVLAIATDDSTVYWLVTDSLRACPMSGCSTPTTLLTDDISDPLAVGAQNLYFHGFDATSDWLGACAKSGCSAPTILTRFDLTQAPTAIITDDVMVYWSTSFQQQDGIHACAITGCTNAIDLATGMGANALAADDQYIYWPSTDGTSGQIARCAKTGCGGKPEVLVSGLVAPVGIAVDDTKIYWVDDGPFVIPQQHGVLSSCEKSACVAPITLASDLDSPWDIRLDQDQLYWMSAFQYQAFKCNTSGCCGGAPTKIFQSDNELYDLAVRAGHAYVAGVSSVIETH